MRKQLRAEASNDRVLPDRYRIRTVHNVSMRYRRVATNSQRRVTRVVLTVVRLTVERSSCNQFPRPMVAYSSSSRRPSPYRPSSVRSRRAPPSSTLPERPRPNLFDSWDGCRIRGSAQESVDGVATATAGRTRRTRAAASVAGLERRIVHACHPRLQSSLLHLPNRRPDAGVPDRCGDDVRGEPRIVCEI